MNKDLIKATRAFQAAVEESRSARSVTAGKAFSQHVHAVRRGFGQAKENLDAMRNLINYRLGENEDIMGNPIIDDQAVRKAREALQTLIKADAALDKAADEIHKSVRNLSALDDFMGFI